MIEACEIGDHKISIDRLKYIILAEFPVISLSYIQSLLIHIRELRVKIVFKDEGNVNFCGFSKKL